MQDATSSIIDIRLRRIRDVITRRWRRQRESHDVINVMSPKYPVHQALVVEQYSWIGLCVVFVGVSTRLSAASAWLPI